MLVETIQARKYVEKENIEGETIEQNEYTLQNNDIETRSISKLSDLLKTNYGSNI